MKAEATEYEIMIADLQEWAFANDVNDSAVRWYSQIAVKSDVATALESPAAAMELGIAEHAMAKLGVRY